MAVIRSRSANGATGGRKSIPNPAAAQARQEWEGKVAAARAEGVAEGRELERQALAEARAEVDARGKGMEEEMLAVQRDADERVQAVEAEWNERLGQALGALETLVERCREQDAAAMQAAENAAVELGCHLAGHLLKQHIDAHQEWMLPLLRAALRQVPDRRQVTIRMHPDDCDALEEQLGALSLECNLLERCELRSDARLPSGSCQVDSGGTMIEASLGNNWERICAQLRESIDDPTWAVGSGDVQVPVEEAPAADDQAEEA